MTAHPTPALLTVNPVACQGIGICAHLAPDLITLDTWGYPIAANRPLHNREHRQATRAITACPRQALLLSYRRPRTGPSG